MYNKEKTIQLCPSLCERMWYMGKKIKLLPWKVKFHWIFHYATKRGVRKKGQRRETWVTWAGPGHGRALLVTARAKQQLMYAGHRKAELRRRHSLWDLCVVLTWSQGCYPASSFTPFTHTNPRLYGRTEDLAAIHTWWDSSSACKDLWMLFRFMSGAVI